MAVVQHESKAAALGTETHSYVEVSLAGQNVAAQFFGDDAKKMGDQALHWIDDVGVPTAVEIKIIYNAETDTARPPKLPPERMKAPREYGEFSAVEMPMTLDLVWVHDDHVAIRDLKTGKKENAHPEQLLVQALGATRLYKKPLAKVGFLFARKTKCEADRATDLGPDALEAASWEMASTLRRLPLAQPTPGDGQVCWFCPARPACPAHQQPTEEERKTA